MLELADRIRAALGGRYRIDRELGRGGMATVYLAEDLRHGRTVAIKVLRPDFTARGYEPERFLREIRISARLTHPQILPLFDSGESDGVLFYVMPYMSCDSLRKRLEQESRLPIEDALRITRAVASALDYAHRQNVLHRDIKPENILLHEGEAVVADFGVARAISVAGHENGTDPGLAIGTPAYMSPEQASADRQLDGRSDLYSLACVLYEMLAGQPPFAGTSHRATMARHVIEPATPVRGLRPDAPVAVEAAIARALAKEPSDRFPTALEFAEALEAPASGLLTVFPLTGGSPGDARAIAVLPFVNNSPDPDAEYFSDGMTDELIDALTKVEGLRVASRTSVFAFKGQSLDVRTIGARLNVSAVLEGTVRQAGRRLRITAGLTSVADGRQLWSERYDRELEDVFAIQDEIARTIVTTLRATVLGDLGDPTPRRYTENLKAYNLYLKGRYCWSKRSTEDVAEAIRYFEAAIAEDAGYALAYTGLSDSYELHIDYRGTPVEESMQLAKAYARKAVELDDTLAEAHSSLAWVTFIYDWNWPEAGREFRRAIELNPRYPSAHQWYAWLLMAQGRAEEAVAEGRVAADLDPAAVSIRRSLGWLYYYARQPVPALEHMHRALTMNPTSEENHRIIGLVHLQDRRYLEAAAAFREAIASSTESAYAQAALGRTLIQLGQRAEAKQLLAGLQARGRERYVSPIPFVVLHTALGENDQAFEWLEKAYQERRGWLAYLRVEPLLDELRGDPRFGKLLERMGLG